MFVANGDVPSDWKEKRIRRWVRAMERNTPDGCDVVTDGEDLGFRHSGCDLCDNPLSGEKYHAVFLCNHEDCTPNPGDVSEN